MKTRIIAAVLTVIIIVACFTACGNNNASGGNATNGNATNGDITSTTLSDSAESKGAFFSDFSTKSLDGKEYTQDVFKDNKLTMVNVWGTFCAPCINEMPDLEKLSKAYAEKGLVIIGIVSDTYDYLKKDNNAEKLKKAEDIVAQAGVTYTNLLPSESLNQARLNYISTFPTTYFLNEKGEIIGSEYVGSHSYEQWASIVEGLLAE